MRNIRTAWSVALVAVLATTLVGCSLLDEPKRAACAALTTQLDDAAAQLSSAAGVPELSVAQLGEFLDSVEAQNPDIAQKMRDGNFSALLEDGGMNIDQLEADTGISQLSDFVTPENLAALDGVGGKLIGMVDQIRETCNF